MSVSKMFSKMSYRLYNRLHLGSHSEDKMHHTH